MRGMRGMRGMRRAVAAALAVVVLGGCLGDQRVDSLKVGECFDDTVELRSGAEISRVPTVPCSERHDFEVFHVTTYPGSSYSVEAIADFGEVTCMSAFEAYVGSSYATSALSFDFFMPTRGSWDQGDRGVTCFAFHVQLDRLRGSVRDSGM